MLTKRVIQLKYNRKAFEDAYDLKVTGNPFRNKQLKTPVRFFSIVTLFLFVFMPFSVFADRFIVITVMLSLVWIAAAYILLLQVVPILKWRKQVQNVIDMLVVSKSNRLEITETGFSYFQESSQYFENWSNVKSYKLEPKFIFIVATENYIFPKETMEENEYKFLIEVLPNVVRTGTP